MTDDDVEFTPTVAEKGGKLKLNVNFKSRGKYAKFQTIQTTVDVIDPDYSNWYTWEAAAKKASDNTFNTYTAYYWIIRFEKYDGTQNHTIWMLEDGTIIMAKAHMKDISDMSEYKEVLHADDESQAETDLSAYKGYFDYSGIDFSKLNLISETTAVEQKNNESYEMLQFLQENEYVYAIHEK